MSARDAITVSDEVRAAVADGRPVVALETTILTHGLPRPRNHEVAVASEERLRRLGVVPATIGVLDGRPVVGLSAAELERLTADLDATKVSVRDLPIVMGRGSSGGTTVATTAWLAHHCGVGVFATGGLGGVHRGASESFDESADLPALAGLPIVVVCSGVKSILDVGATLERLETLGVPVLGYRTDAFPGFYVRDSGFPTPARVDTPAEAAAVARARDALGLPAAVLVANPVDLDAQLDPEVHRAAVTDALAEADVAGITGQRTTPYLLDRIRETTADASLAANLAVYTGNVTLAGEIAVALSTGISTPGSG